MRIPRFLIVLHHDVFINDWTRLPLTSSSSTPSVTKNSTSCGVSLGALVPLPGLGISVFMLVIALSILVSASLLLLLEVSQLLEYTSSWAMFPADVWAAERLEVNPCIVLKLTSNVSIATR